MTFDQEKAAARQQAKALRKSLIHDGVAGHAALQLAQWADALYALANGPPIAGYFPKGTELDIRPLVERLWLMKAHTALPVMLGSDRPMIFRQWCKDTALHAGSFGIQEPGAETPLVRPGLVLAPMLAFDRQGWRLGYGGGYYDRTLESLGKAHPKVIVVGVAFAAQEIKHVPHASHDHPLDYVVTETELIQV